MKRTISTIAINDRRSAVDLSLAIRTFVVIAVLAIAAALYWSAGALAQRADNDFTYVTTALSGETITVTTCNDLVDFAGAQQVGDLPGPDGRVSFREATIAANGTAGPQTIAFAIPVADFWWWTDVALLKSEQGAFFITDSGTTVDFTTQTTNIGDTNPTGLEVMIYNLVPNWNGVPAVFVKGNNCLIKGLSSAYQSGYGVRLIGSNNRVIGSDKGSVIIEGYSDGSIPMGNVVGGTGPGEGNNLIGVRIGGPAENNIVIGNTIIGGVDVIASTQYGVIARNNRIGGPTSAERNVISGSGYFSSEGYPVGEQVGVVDADGTIIEGNYIGTTVDGMARYPQQIGAVGVEVRDSRGTIVRGNLIAGLRSVGTNHYNGQIFGQAVFVGATNASSYDTLVEGNTIGLAADGVTLIVTRQGVTVSPMTGSFHAFRTRVANNRIAGVETRGIVIGSNENGVTLTGNTVRDSGLLGIDLFYNFNGIGGVTLNDAGDVDEGGNGLQNFPVLQSASVSGPSVTAAGTLDTWPSEQFTVEFFSSPSCDSSGFGEGAAFLGSTTITTDAAGHATFLQTLTASAAVGNQASTTATRLSTGDTSEFSGCIAFILGSSPTPTFTPTPAPTPTASNTPTPIATTAATPPNYRLTDLGTINTNPQTGQIISNPAGINQQGQVTGSSYSGTSSHAARFTNGVVEDLGTIPGGITSSGWGINDLGQVAGDSEYSINGGSIRHAALFANGAVTDLGALPLWGNYARGNGVNNAGEVVGHSGPNLSTTVTHAFIWDSINGMRDIDPAGGYAKAFSINNSHVVTGTTTGSGSGAFRAFIWDASNGVRDIGTIAGSTSSGAFINDNGHVTGTSTINTFDNRQHAFLYDGTMHDLGALGDNDFFSDRSTGNGLNIHDQVVGSTYRPYQGGGNYQIPFIYTGGQMYDLETLVDASGADYRLYTATGINDAGQIAVSAIQRSTGQIRAVLLTPNIAGTPLPTATASASSTNTPTPTPTGAPLAAISGTVTYGNAVGAPTLRSVSNVLISGAGSTSVSTLTGFPGGAYSLGGFGAGSYTVTPAKANGANGISSFDAARIAQHASGINLLNGSQLIVADVSENGTVSSFDAGQVARYAVSIPGSGGTGTWVFSPVSRSYPSVTTNIMGQDYSALLMGEVSGNWTDNGLRPFKSGGSVRSASVALPRLLILANDQVIIPVSIRGVVNTGIISYEFQLRYDPSVVRPLADPVDLVRTVSGRLSAVANAEEPGLLRVAVYGPVPLNRNGVLINLRFTAVGAPGSVSPLTWERIMFNEGDPQATATDGQVALSATAPNEAEFGGPILTTNGQSIPSTGVPLTDSKSQAPSIISTGFGPYTAGAAFGAPGDLDSSFGTGGQVVTMFSSSAGGTRLGTPEAVIVQPDGKIIAAGMARNLLNGGQAIGLALVRYNVDGSLDEGFDGDGKVHIRLNGFDTIHALAVSPDGKIVATGLTNLSGGGNNDFAFLVTRFNPNGSLDTSFNGSGYRIDNWTSGLDEAVACAVQPDGKIIAGGFLDAGTAATDFAMARYNLDGSLDTGFGSGGLVRTDFDGTLDGAQTVVLMPDGKIILGGAIWNAEVSNGDFGLIGYNSDGTVDTAFGTGGKVRTDFDGESQNTFDLELTTGNKLLLTGCVGQPGLWNIAAIRYNADGSLDSTFDGDGKFRHDFLAGAIEGGVAVKTQTNGKIVIAADVEPRGTEFDFAVMRLNADGTIDTGFGNNGITFVDFGRFRPGPLVGFSNDDPTDMWIAPDGKIVVAGDVELEPNMTHDFGVARFLGDPVSSAIAGTIIYGNAVGAPTLRSVSNVLISGSGATSVTTLTAFPGGEYSLSGFGAGSYTVTPTKTGGANNITSFDAARIAQHAAGINFLTGNQLIVADVSENGAVSSFDAGQVARYAVSVPGSGGTGNWIFGPASRSYPSVTANITDQNYSALLMGEVSGNWTNTGARPSKSGESKRGMTVNLPRLVSPTNAEITIPVTIRGVVVNKGIISYEFDLRYDPSVIQPQADPVGLAGTASRGFSFASNAEEAGLLRVAVFGTMPLDGDGLLLNLKFTAVGAPGTVSPLTWERLMLNEGDPQAIAAAGQVRLSAAAADSAEMSGRLLNSMGQGIPNANVTLTDTAGKSRSIISNGFGYYRLGGLKVAQTYTIKVESRGWTFPPLTISVTGGLISVDMIADH